MQVNVSFPSQINLCIYFCLPFVKEALVLLCAIHHNITIIVCLDNMDTSPVMSYFVSYSLLIKLAQGNKKEKVLIKAKMKYVIFLKTNIKKTYKKFAHLYQLSVKS